MKSLRTPDEQLFVQGLSAQKISEVPAHKKMQKPYSVEMLHH